MTDIHFEAGRPATPSALVRTEIEAVLRQKTSHLGQVFNLLEQGKNAEQIRVEVGVDSSGFVSNNKRIIRALLDGDLPEDTPETAKGVASQFRVVLKNPGLSADARRVLFHNLKILDGQASKTSSPPPPPHPTHRQRRRLPPPPHPTHRQRRRLPPPPHPTHRQRRRLPPPPHPTHRQRRRRRSSGPDMGAMVPTDDIKAEIAAILRQDTTRLGEVFNLFEQGKNPEQIRIELGLASSGSMSNYRRIIASLLDGALPEDAPSMVKQVASKFRLVLKNSDLSADARRVLSYNLRIVKDRARSTPRRRRGRHRR